MLDKSRLAIIAGLIRAHISISDVEKYCKETGISREDFVPISPRRFDGQVFAIDGSNVVICDWSVASLNLIRAGYAVYRGTEWQRTVITYDDIFLADCKSYVQQFDDCLEGIFGLKGIVLKDAELERLSSYFRELQEYVALYDAVYQADPGDLILYDGGFTWKELPLGDVLRKIFRAAERKGVDILGISKSSSISWGEEVSRPFLQNTAYAAGLLRPGVPWRLCLSKKKVNPDPDKWKGGKIYVARLDGRCEHAFRVDAPVHVEDRIDEALGKLAGCSCSAECRGYPHALFRAHRDIRITDQEGGFLMLRLMDVLGEMGLSEAEVRGALLDFHDVIEMKQRKPA